MLSRGFARQLLANTAGQVSKKLHDGYDNDAFKERLCQNWFQKFRSGDFAFKGNQHSNRPVGLNGDEIKTTGD